MPREKKHEPNWERVVVVILVLFPLGFYLAYLRQNPSPWKALEDPIFVACALALLASLCGFAFRQQYPDRDFLNESSQPKTDWRERIIRVAFTALVFAGFFFCAFDKGFIKGTVVWRRTLDILVPIVIGEFWAGLRYNDHSRQPDGNALPDDLPSLPYFLFPSDRRKR